MTGTHKRNTSPMLLSPRCGAKTRMGNAADRLRLAANAGVECMVVPGVRSAPGNTNALTHGNYTEEAVQRRATMRKLIRKAKALKRSRTPRVSARA